MVSDFDLSGDDPTCGADPFKSTGLPDELPGYREWLDDVERARDAAEGFEDPEAFRAMANAAADDEAPANPLSIDPADCERVGGSHPVYLCPRCSGAGKPICCGTRPDPEDHTRRVCSGGCDANGHHAPKLPRMLVSILHEIETRGGECGAVSGLHFDAGTKTTVAAVKSYLLARGWSVLEVYDAEYLTVRRGQFRITICRKVDGVSLDLGYGIVESDTLPAA
jgi:hypothetical protein